MFLRTCGDFDVVSVGAQFMRRCLAPWRDAFLGVVQDPATAELLKTASLAEDLKSWTTCLTSAVTDSCGSLGWIPAAKGHRMWRTAAIGTRISGDRRDGLRRKQAGGPLAVSAGDV